MTKENIHRLLKRQFKKFDIPEAFVEEYKDFFKAVDAAYKSSDADLVQLETVLELSSQELYKANKLLHQENLEKTNQVESISNQLERVMANVPDIIFEVDEFGNFTYLNSAWKKYSGEEPGLSIGKNFMEFSNGIQYFDLSTKEKIDNRDFKAFTTVFSRSDKEGNLKWWEMSVKPLRDNANVIQGAIGSLVDVTVSKETEEELIKANEAKGKFLSTMSHEIRTPLNAVIAISNILLMENPLPEQMKNLKALKFSSKHLLTLVNDILDYNKLTSGNLVFNPTSFSLKKNVEGIISSFNYIAEDKGVSLISIIEGEGPDLLVGDVTRLSQVLTNLVSNAVKFTNEGQVELRVSYKSKDAERCVLLFNIKDTGIGIDESKLDLIFDRFTQAENSTSKDYGGTGLGLAICKKILELQGSKIEVSSVSGEGSEFSFELSFDVSKKVPLSSSSGNNKPVFDLDSLRVLVVDDNNMNLLVANQFLKNWNVIYDNAKNGEEAIQMVKQGSYDVVLMDLRMPVKDGFTAAVELRELNYTMEALPIIALSASVSADIQSRVAKHFMNDYLCKPFDPVHLYEKLANVKMMKNRLIEVS